MKGKGIAIADCRLRNAEAKSKEQRAGSRPVGHRCNDFNGLTTTERSGVTPGHLLGNRVLGRRQRNVIC